MITQDQLKQMLDYNQETGVFTWLKSNSNVVKVGQIAGSYTRSANRVYIKVLGKRYMAHRLAWLYVHGKFPLLQIDHKDGNGSNNAISNLREATNGQNGQNKRKARKDCLSGLIGAHYIKSRDSYQSHIVVNGKKKYLGYFKKAEDAHKCYVDAKRKLHEYCTI